MHLRRGIIHHGTHGMLIRATRRNGSRAQRRQATIPCKNRILAKNARMLIHSRINGMEPSLLFT